LYFTKERNGEDDTRLASLAGALLRTPMPCRKTLIWFWGQ